MRTLVVMSDYVIDELVWHSDDPTVMDLPIHLDAATATVEHSGGDRQRSRIYDGDFLTDTLGALRDATSDWLGGYDRARLVARKGDRVLHGFLMPSIASLLYRVTAPGPPSSSPSPMLLLRVASPGGSHWVRFVWSWDDAVERLTTNETGAHIIIDRRDDARDHHRRVRTGWKIERTAGRIQRTVELGGMTSRTRNAPMPSAQPPAPQSHNMTRLGPLVFELGAQQYRRSEERWEHAGRPTARVGLLLAPNELIVDIAVRKAGAFTFVASDATNPYDNEAPDINGDGVQLYLIDRTGASAWVMIPETGTNASGSVRARVIDGWDTARSVHSAWRQTDDGYSMRVGITLPAVADAGAELAIGVVVNEKPPERVRRRGQLVLGGVPGFVYLRGDREDPSSLPRFIVAL
jgi:hypothetical protein